MKRWLSSLVLGVCLAATGCAGPGFGARPVTCAAIAVRDAKPTPLTRGQYYQIEPKLSAHLARQGLVLVPDIARADRLATIEYVPDPVTPGMGRLLVLDVRANTFQASRNRSRDPIDLDIGADRDGAGRREDHGFPPAPSYDGNRWPRL